MPRVLHAPPVTTQRPELVSHGSVGGVVPVPGTAITQVSVGTEPTRAWTVPTMDGDCSSATGVASTTCPMGTVTLTCPAS